MRGLVDLVYLHSCILFLYSQWLFVSLSRDLFLVLKINVLFLPYCIGPRSVCSKKVAQSSNFQTSGIEVLKFVGKNTDKNNMKIKTVLFIEVFYVENIIPHKKIQTNTSNTFWHISHKHHLIKVNKTNMDV